MEYKMTEYNPKPGDIVSFTHPSIGTTHRGTIVEYRPGRDTRATKRDFLVRFTEPIWHEGPLEAWCAKDDLTLIWNTLRKADEVKPTVTYTNSSTTTTTKFNNQNISLNKDNKLAESSVSLPERPWTRYYVTADEFFEVLRVAFDDTYGGGSQTPWHPEDMYVNVLSTLEIVANTLSNMANIKAHRPLKGVKEI
jgi:hypothetical protein